MRWEKRTLLPASKEGSGEERVLGVWLREPLRGKDSRRVGEKVLLLDSLLLTTSQDL